MKKIYLPILLLASSIFLPVNAEGGCSNYYGRGMEIIRDEEGEKFFATAEVSVPIDDRDLYLDSFEEAEMEAKNMIAKLIGFLTRFHFSAIKRYSITGFSNLQVYLSIRAKLLFTMKLNLYFVKNDTILVKLISYKLNGLYTCRNNVCKHDNIKDI